MPTKKQRQKKRAEKPKGRGLTLAPKKKATKKPKPEAPALPDREANLSDDAS